MATIGPIDGGLDDDLTKRIIDASARIEIEGAIIRCVVVGVDQDRYRTLDLPRLRRHFAGCLHFELKPTFARKAPGIGAPQDLRTFIAARGVPEGIEIEELLARAERLLGEVDDNADP
jgi:hypothetical protein